MEAPKILIHLPNQMNRQPELMRLINKKNEDLNGLFKEKKRGITKGHNHLLCPFILISCRSFHNHN